MKWKLKLIPLLILIALFLASCSPVFKGAEVTVGENEALFHFIDVGQGDCTLIQTADEAILIDAGTYESGSIIYKYLRNLGINKLDCFIATHPHEDHMGGAATVLSGITTDTVYVNGDTSYSRFYEKFIDVLLEKNTTPIIPQAGETFQVGNISIQFLSPDKDYGNLNDNSLVALVRFGDTAFLFMGDAESPAEKDIIEKYDINADILKVGHHGSRNASSLRFLSQVSPSVCVIPCGKDNSYGHPHKEAISRIKNIGAPILRTDTDGNIIIRSDSKNIYDASGNIFEKISQAENFDFSYIGNKKSKTFHTPDCPNLPGEKNKVIFDNRDKAVSSGYKSCGNCNP